MFKLIKRLAWLICRRSRRKRFVRIVGKDLEIEKRRLIDLSAMIDRYNSTIALFNSRFDQAKRSCFTEWVMANAQIFVLAKQELTKELELINRELSSILEKSKNCLPDRAGAFQRNLTIVALATLRDRWSANLSALGKLEGVEKVSFSHEELDIFVKESAQKYHLRINDTTGKISVILADGEPVDLKLSPQMSLSIVKLIAARQLVPIVGMVRHILRKGGAA